MESSTTAWVPTGWGPLRSRPRVPTLLLVRIESGLRSDREAGLAKASPVERRALGGVGEELAKAGPLTLLQRLGGDPLLALELHEATGDEPGVGRRRTHRFDTAGDPADGPDPARRA